MIKWIASKLGYSREPIFKRSKTADIIDTFGHGMHELWSALIDIKEQTLPYYFKRNPWFSAGVLDISESLSSVNAKIVRKETDEEIESEEIADFMETPNPEQTFPMFVQEISTHLEIAGNCYLEHVRMQGRPVFGERKVITEAYALSPKRITVRATAKDRKQFIYRVNNKEITLNMEEVVHGMYIKDYDDDILGMPPSIAALEDMIIDRLIEIYNKHYIGNGCRPGFVFEIPQQVPKPEVSRFKAKMKQKISQPQNAAKNMYLTEGITATPLNATMRDIEYLNQRKWSREAILGLLGVPPIQVGVFEHANYANAKEQKRIYWEDTLMPKLNALEFVLTRLIRRVFADPTLTFKWKREEIKALKEDEKQRAEIDEIEVRSGIKSPNEIREDKKLDPMPGGDEPRISMNLVPLSDAELDVPDFPQNEQASNDYKPTIDDTKKGLNRIEKLLERGNGSE